MVGSGDDDAMASWWTPLVASGGRAGATLAGGHWTSSPLGPPTDWPAGLRAAVTLCLPAQLPMAIWWGPDAVLIHNDAYSTILGDDRGEVLGAPGARVWPEVWDRLGGLIRQTLLGAEATWSADQPVLLRHRELVEERYFSSSFSPIFDGDGRPGGVLTVVTETTERVVGARRLAVAGALAGALVDAVDDEQVCRRAATVIAGDTADVSSVEVYLPGADGLRRQARAGASAHPPGGGVAADRGEAVGPGEADAGGRWPLSQVWHDRRPCLVTPPPAGAGGGRPAVVTPVIPAGSPDPVAVLVVAVGPHRRADADFRAFAELTAAHLGSALAAVRRAQAERSHIRAVQATRADRRFRSLVEAAATVVWTTDGHGAVTVPQASWQSYTGQGWPEHAGAGWLEMIHPDDRARTARSWQEAVRDERRLFAGDGRLWHAVTGAYRHFAARATAIRDDDGVVVEWIGTFIDIQDLRSAEMQAARTAAITDALLASSPVGFGWVDPAMRFQHVNPALCALNRLPLDAHLGRRPDELFGLDGSRMVELMRRALDSGAVTGVEFTMADPDEPGTARHYIASYFTIRVAGSDDVVGVGFTVLDVTERTHLLQALGEQRTRHERLAATDVLAVFGGVDAQITEANDAFLDMLGYTREDLADGRLSWPDLTPPGWQDVDRESLRSLAETGRSRALAKEYLHRDGHRVPVLIGVVALQRSPLRWLAHATDLSAERRAQAELRLFRTLVERSGDLIAVADTDGRAVYVNPAGRGLLGLAQEAVPTTGLLDLAAPQVRAQWRDELLPAALRQGQHRTETKLAHVHTGAVLDVDQQTFTISRDEAGRETSRLAVVARDITERQHSLRRADALARLSGALSAAASVPAIARAAVEHTSTVFAASRARVVLLNPRLGELDVVAAYPAAVPDGATTATPLRPDDPLMRTARENRQLTDDTVAEDGGTTVRGLSVPLRYNDGGTLGALGICWDPPRSVAPAAMDAARSVLDTVAGLCSQALQRVELSEATQQVAALAAQLSASRSTAQATEAILSAAPRILGARLPAVILPLNARRLRLFHHDLPSTLAEQYLDLTIDDPRPIAESFRTGERIFIADREAFRERYPGLHDTAGAHGLTTTIAVPLLDPRGHALAAIGMGWSRSRPLRATDLALLDTITDLCQQTFERTRLAAAEHDLVTRLAGRVTTTPEQHPAFAVAVRYQPAITGLNLGGDWYDVIALPGGRLAVVVGDVVGHQVEAAADMAQLRTVLNTLVRLDTPLDEVFARVTALLGRGFLGTALAMIIDPGAGSLHLVRAGHPYPVIVPAAGAPRILHTPSVPPLGMIVTPAPVTTVEFGVGDTVVAFTDGLVERRSRSYDDGVAELRGLLAEHADRSVDDLADIVLHRIPGTDDDRALVLIRRR